MPAGPGGFIALVRFSISLSIQSFQLSRYRKRDVKHPATLVALSPTTAVSLLSRVRWCSRVRCIHVYNRYIFLTAFYHSKMLQNVIMKSLYFYFYFKPILYDISLVTLAFLRLLLHDIYFFPSFSFRSICIFETKDMFPIDSIW